MLSRRSISSFVSLLLFWCAILGGGNNSCYVLAEEEKSPDAAAETSTSPDAAETTTTTEEVKETKPHIPFSAQDHTDWGNYYDPQNVFCGKYDCYKILGFDYENFGSVKPDTKVITKRYRSLSREWHPDKSKHKDAKERFVKIARAYEVLTDNQKRAEYDFLRYNQEAYFQKYGANVLWQYAPKSDATFIVLFLLILANWFTWIAQKQRWQNVADRLIKAAVEDWSPNMGGTTQSKHLREEALEILAKETLAKEAKQQEESNGASSNGTKSSKTKGKKEKVSGKEKKRLESESVKPIITVLVGHMHDFGAGFHKPTWRDLFLVKVVKFPYHFWTGVWWQAKYTIRRLQKKELSEAERFVLTERAVGHVTWDLASEEDHQAMVKRELWIMDNLVGWKEEQEVKSWSKADQKYYAKMKKKGTKEQ